MAQQWWYTQSGEIVGFLDGEWFYKTTGQGLRYEWSRLSWAAFSASATGRTTQR